MKWSQEQAVAFEAARECITALMAIHTGKLIDATSAHGDDSEEAKAIETQITSLFAERAALTPTDAEGVERVLSTYGSKVREGLEAKRRTLTAASASR